jgi:hypothetical protein
MGVPRVPSRLGEAGIEAATSCYTSAMFPAPDRSNLERHFTKQDEDDQADLLLLDGRAAARDGAEAERRGRQA